MFNFINDKIEKLDSNNIYIFVCNIKDKELMGAKNDTLINIYCKNSLKGPYIIKPEINTYLIEGNVIYLFTMIFGGKSQKKDTDEQRFEYFKNLFESLRFNKKTICLDYGNLIHEPGSNNDLYINYLKDASKNYNLNINFYINKKYKIISSIESDLNIHTVKFPYKLNTIEDIFII